MTGQSIDAARLLGRVRTLGDLCFQHLAHGIPDRDQLADDPDMIFSQFRRLAGPCTQ
ncbi:hypothetical protein ACVITL_006040 [Rhizobium pisi]